MLGSFPPGRLVGVPFSFPPPAQEGGERYSMFNLFLALAVFIGFGVAPLDGILIPGVEPPDSEYIEPIEPPLEGPVLPGFPPESWGEPCPLIGLQ